MTTATATAGTLEFIDPQTIDVATNVRTAAEATLDKEFLDSVAANGVIVPIVATLGYAQAPVVVVDDEDHWAGFRPDHIDRVATHMG